MTPPNYREALLCDTCIHLGIVYEGSSPRFNAFNYCNKYELKVSRWSVCDDYSRRCVAFITPEGKNER